MRINSDTNSINKTRQKEFALYLLQLGEGKLPVLNNTRYTDDIKLPENCSGNIDEQELINKVFPDILQNYMNIEFMCSRAILCAKNFDVDRINELCILSFPGAVQDYLSVDSAISEKDKSIFEIIILIKFLR